MAIHPAWSLATFLGLASPVLAGVNDCRLALVLALDVSSSVDKAEYWLQREGTARALLAPEVVRAFLLGDPVALFVFEWSSPFYQEPLTPGWQVVHSAEDLMAIAEALRASPRSNQLDPYRSTALGSALSFAANSFHEAPRCRARTVDVSGDGVNNHNFDPSYAFAHYPLEGVTVNALVIGVTDGEMNLASWFQEEVLHGPGAFLVQVDSYEDYERAMRAKLLRELELPVVSGWPVVEPRS